MDIYIQLFALPRQSKCQSSIASKSRKELLERTNLELLLEKNAIKIGEVFLSWFHMQLTYSGGDLLYAAVQPHAASCITGCNASSEFSRVASNCAMNVRRQELHNTVSLTICVPAHILEKENMKWKKMIDRFKQRCLMFKYPIAKYNPVNVQPYQMLIIIMFLGWITKIYIQSNKKGHHF